MPARTRGLAAERNDKRAEITLSFRQAAGDVAKGPGFGFTYPGCPLAYYWFGFQSSVGTGTWKAYLGDPFDVAEVVRTHPEWRLSANSRYRDFRDINFLPSLPDADEAMYETWLTLDHYAALSTFETNGGMKYRN